MGFDFEKVGAVDPDLFVACSRAYHEGAQYPLVPPASGPGLYLADKPINRGMMSVLNELKHRGVAEATKFSVMWRIMHFGEVFEDARLKPFLQSAESPGAVMVSEALVKACAEAKMVRDGEHSHFDVDDIARIAKRYYDEGEGGAS
jgi:hypothetical protein